MESNEFWEEYINSMDEEEDPTFQSDAICPVIKLGRILPANDQAVHNPLSDEVEVVMSTMTFRFALEGTGMTYGEWCEFIKIQYPGWCVLAVIEEQDFHDWKTCEEYTKLELDDPWRTG